MPNICKALRSQSNTAVYVSAFCFLWPAWRWPCYVETCNALRSTSKYNCVCICPFFSSGQPDGDHVRSKHVADLWTKYIVLFWLDLFRIFEYPTLLHINVSWYGCHVLQWEISWAISVLRELRKCVCSFIISWRDALFWTSDVAPSVYPCVGVHSTLLGSRLLLKTALVAWL
jgi:hypothetical protein